MSALAEFFFRREFTTRLSDLMTASVQFIHLGNFATTFIVTNFLLRLYETYWLQTYHGPALPDGSLHQQYTSNLTLYLDIGTKVLEIEGGRGYSKNPFRVYGVSYENSDFWEGSRNSFTKTECIENSRRNGISSHTMPSSVTQRLNPKIKLHAKINCCLNRVGSN